MPAVVMFDVRLDCKVVSMAAARTCLAGKTSAHLDDDIVETGRHVFGQAA